MYILPFHTLNEKDSTSEKERLIFQRNQPCVLFFCFLVVIHSTSCRHGMDKPDVAANDTVVTNLCISAQDSRIGIDRHMVAKIWMTLAAFDRMAIGIFFKALRA